MSNPRKLLFVDNNINSFVAYRMALAEAASKAGFEVHVAAPPGKAQNLIAESGFRFHALPLTRRGMSIGTELHTIRTLFQLYRELRPDLIHHLRLKPVLYGGIAARLAKMPAEIHLLTGLGHVFTSTSWKARFLRSLTTMGCRLAFRTR